MNLDFWQKCGFGNIVLLPFSWLFAAVVWMRRVLYRLGVFSSKDTGAFVIVVGNIIAGGGGKTPVIIALVKALQEAGFKPGVISRGYGGKQRAAALVEKDDWKRFGDEPVLVSQRTGAPVCVGRDRAEAARLLVKNKGCKVIISDDGLQHYAMRRNFEICVVNGEYGFGNGWHLPAGPLREGVGRVDSCDAALIIGGAQADTKIEFTGVYPIGNPKRIVPLATLGTGSIAAVAGIARPQGFFKMLESNKIFLSEQVGLADHSRLSEGALADLRADTIVMTEKDAVKYPPHDERLRVVAVDCKLPDDLLPGIISAINGEKEGKK